MDQGQSIRISHPAREPRQNFKDIICNEAMTFDGELIKSEIAAAAVDFARSTLTVCAPAAAATTENEHV